MKQLLVLLTGFFLATSVLAASEKTLSVSGLGISQTEPDTASLRLGVEVVRPTAREAQASNATTMQKVVSAINKLGIKKEFVQTSGFSIWAEMKYSPNQAPKTAGYRCSNQVCITIEDLTKVSSVIDAGISAGANTVQGIQFSKRNDAQVKKLALEKAVKDASAKASAIAQAAGLRLKGIKDIIESGTIVPTSVDNSVRAMGLGGPEASGTVISPGLLEVRGSVTLIYRID